MAVQRYRLMRLGPLDIEYEEIELLVVDDSSDATTVPSPADTVASVETEESVSTASTVSKLANHLFKLQVSKVPKIWKYFKKTRNAKRRTALPMATGSQQRGGCVKKMQTKPKPKRQQSIQLYFKKKAAS